MGAILVGRVSGAGNGNQDDVGWEVFLGRLRVSGANGCEEEEGDDGNARCQRKNAYFRGSFEVDYE
jgi:hypothetical protein